MGRDELVQYGVEFRHVEVSTASRRGASFTIHLQTGEKLKCRKLLVASGVVDKLPAVEGARELYGSSLFHCPYCDGWEVRDQPLAVYGRGRPGVGLAVSLKTWSDDVILCTDGPGRLSSEDAAQLKRHQIPCHQQYIDRFEGRNGRLGRIIFRGGGVLDRKALFFTQPQRQHCELAASLGCEFTHRGTVKTSRKQNTNVPGLFVAGDASHDSQIAIVAAAEGAKAGIAINMELQNEERW
jgi:thioredoxin reductase